MINKELKFLTEDLLEFMKKKYNFDRNPKIIFKEDNGNAKNILGKTGHYDPISEEIVIYCTNRHPKDILRSLAHEIIHHLQKYSGSLKSNEAADSWDENYILHNKKLKMMEADAFLEGNLSLREWEAYKKESGMNPQVDKKTLDEKKKKKRKLSKLQLKKAKKMAASMEKKQGYSAEKAHKIAYAQVQKENVQESKQVGTVVQPEVVVINDALKDSVVYNKDDRACNDLYTGREELVFQELLKKFGIKK